MEEETYTPTRYTLWLYPHQIAKLKERAKEKGLSVSDWVRKLIDKAR